MEMHNIQSQPHTPASILQISWSRLGFSFEWKRNYIKDDSVNGSGNTGKEKNIQKTWKRSEILIDWI